ncbi:O-antigen ligase family protein [Plantactinospora sp. B5E13]|uniref:O-antigen ligase family protein n=1 Tax=Plantactinospora sp. B5E13 TaxID=3153758 RepID=UPI00325ED3AE
MADRALSARLAPLLARLTPAPDRYPLLAVVTVALAVPQFYLLPRGSVDISLATLTTVALAPVVLLGVRGGTVRDLLRTGVFRLVLALLVVRVVALAWSPDPRAGLQYITLLGQFAGMLLLMGLVSGQGCTALRRLERWYWPLVLTEAALVLLFRLAPGLEDAYLRSVGGFFAGQNTVAALFGDHPNNVLDPAKAGGFFINANVAAMFLGINGLAALALSRLTGTRWVRLAGLAALATVPFTGSKSAIVLVLLLPAAAYGLHHLRRSTPVVRRYLLVGAAVAGVALVLLLVLNRAFLGALAEAFVGRAEIWRFGGEAMREHPILGLGYGGWDAGFAGYADRHDMWRILPPHNILLGAWAVTGLVGLGLTVAYFVAVGRLVLRRRHTTDERFLGYAGAALGWILLQGLGENTDIFGDIHLIPVVALLLVCLVRPVAEESKDRAHHPDRRDPASPAVPSLGDVHREPGAGDADLPSAVRGPGRGAEPAGHGLG